jgi:hypothetical protein
MINLSIKKFLKILFSFIGVTYLSTFIYSIIIGFQLETAYDIGKEVGYNIGFVSYYVVLIAIAFISFFLINLLVSRSRLSNK